MNMPPACVYSAGDGNGKIGRQGAYLPDRGLRDGVSGRNGNSRPLAALIGRSPGRRQHRIGADPASLSGLLLGQELCLPTARAHSRELLHQGGLANVHAQEYCCCCGGCRCDVHSGSGATSDAILWRANLSRTSQEGHCSGGGGSPEEQLFCRSLPSWTLVVTW